MKEVGENDGDPCKQHSGHPALQGPPGLISMLPAHLLNKLAQYNLSHKLVDIARILIRKPVPLLDDKNNSALHNLTLSSSFVSQLSIHHCVPLCIMGFKLRQCQSSPTSIMKSSHATVFPSQHSRSSSGGGVVPAGREASFACQNLRMNDGSVEMERFNYVRGVDGRNGCLKCDIKRRVDIFADSQVWVKPLTLNG